MASEYSAPNTVGAPAGSEGARRAAGLQMRSQRSGEHGASPISRGAATPGAPPRSNTFQRPGKPPWRAGLETGLCFLLLFGISFLSIF